MTETFRIALQQTFSNTISMADIRAVAKGNELRLRLAGCTDMETTVVIELEPEWEFDEDGYLVKDENGKYVETGNMITLRVATTKATATAEQARAAGVRP
jgi:hypothetical protein